MVFYFRRCFLEFLLLVVFVCVSGVPVLVGENPVNIKAHELFEASFEINTKEKNPFFLSEIRVDALVSSDTIGSVTVPCFYDGRKVWKMRFTPTLPGDYEYRVVMFTPEQVSEVTFGTFTVSSQQKRGFVRLADRESRYFAFSNGESYFPLGENLGWVNPPELSTWLDYLDECEDAGINWIRIWMCPWGMTELVWKDGYGSHHGRPYHGFERYNLKNAAMIDGIFQAAEERGIYIQWVINHHGQYSARTNPIWDENPYNTANGGFLDSPEQFFTSDQAKKHYRDRLRYLVARWGYSTHLMAWEFWNEVNLTSNYHFSAVKSWHEVMSSYLHGIDPYDHLQTTSASGNNPSVYTIEGLDYLQTHAYVNNIISKLMTISERNAREYPNAPHFFGEMSYDYRGPNREDEEGVILHNQLWASVHSWDAGTAMTWWWDNWIRPFNLYSHFRIISSYIKDFNWLAENPASLETHIQPKPGNLGDFVFTPGLGWASTSRKEFKIHPNGEVEHLNECSQFVHGQYHRDMAPNPVFLIHLDYPAEFGFQIDRVSASGANCIVWVDDERVFRRVFAPSENDSTINEAGNVSIPLPEGQHRIIIRNTGLDWFRVKNYRIGNFTQRPKAYARGNENRILLWIHDQLHQFATLDRYRLLESLEPTRLTLPEIQQGVFSVERFDPYTGEVKELPDVTATDSGFVIEIPAFSRDIAFRIQQKPSMVDSLPSIQ